MFVSIGNWVHHKQFISNHWSLPRWRRGSGLDFGSDDPGSIPGLPSPLVKTSSVVPVPVSR